jgi:hypothetical protein
LGDLVTPGTLGFAAEDGDAVYVFDSLATPPNFKPVYTYYDGAGWLSDAPGSTPAGPVIPVATGFFVVKSSAATKTSWDRNFSVNP